MATLPEIDEFPAGIYQIEMTDPVVGGPPNEQTKAGLTNIPLLQLAKRTRYLWNRLTEQVVTESLEVTVGPSGHHATINAAIAALATRRPRGIGTSVRGTIRLLAGFVMSEQVIVRNADMGWLRIVSDAPAVTINRAALIEQFGDTYPAFRCAGGGTLPEIAARFIMNTAGTGTNRSGIALFDRASLTVAVGCGVTNAGGFGLIAQGSDVFAQGAIFSGAGSDGVRASRGARVEFRGGVATGCGGYGIRAETSSSVDANSCDLTGCAAGGVVAMTLARVELNLASCRTGSGNASSDIQVNQGGMIHATSTTGGTNVSKNTLTANGIIFG